MEPLRLTSDMLAGVAALEAAVFPHPWHADALGLLCGETAFGFAVMDGTMPVAYGGMLTVLDEGQITNIATHRAYRRRGYAAAVLTALLTEARARGIAFVTLEVRESNTAAIALYEKYGFAVVGRRPRFYTAPVETGLIMRCDLGGK